MGAGAEVRFGEGEGFCWMGQDRKDKRAKALGAGKGKSMVGGSASCLVTATGSWTRLGQRAN